MAVNSVPSLGEAIGIRAVPGAGPAAAELALGGGSQGMLDVAMLADLALGAALRARVGRGQLLPTLTLTLEADLAQVPSGVSVQCWSQPVLGGLGRAYGVLRHDGDPVGQCAATFAVPAGTPELAPLPWEVPGDPAAGDDGARRSAEALFPTFCSVTGHTTIMRPDELLLNRSGLVQGGVLFRLAASLPGQEARMVSGHLQFLSAAGPRAPLSARPLVQGTTRRTLFANTSIWQQDRLVASGSFVFRRD